MANTDKNNNGATDNSAFMFVSNAATQKKTTQGRKKIEIKKIDKLSSRQVTFSKRRAGLFKKASELCILTGAEVAIIVQSSGKRVYAFGHPSVDSVIDKYLTGASTSSWAVATASSSGRASTAATTLTAAEVHEHNVEYNRLCQELEAEKKRMEMQEKAKFVNNGSNFWWNEPIDHLGLEELEEYMGAVEELRKNILTRADELALLNNSRPRAMNNVDLNQTMTTTVGIGFDDLVLNHHNHHHHQTNYQYCSSSSSIIPYDNHHFGYQ